MQSQSMQNNQPKKRYIASIVSIILVVGASLYIWLNLQYIFDWVNYQTYNPSASVASIADNSGFTDDGLFAFYSAQPAVDGTRAFNVKCDRKEENIAILGCYTANKIYIFDVTDERLDGIQEVTAVHEMLHFVYQRTSGADLEKIHALLDVEAKKLEKDKDFAERMEFYARTEPGERYNELFSIVGTEVGEISSELEEYYEKYFDRQHIVKLHKEYKKEFDELEARAEQLKKQIDSVSEKIDRAKDAYARDIKSLDRDITNFNARADNSDFTSQSQFDSERASLINRATQLKGTRASINKMVDTYNKLIKEHNDTVVESSKLYKSIDSSLAPAPSV